MTFSRRELIVIGLALTLTVVAWVLANSYPGYDTYYHLVWGRELLAGQVPSIDAYQAPTLHPLYLAVAAALGALVGDDSAQLMVLLGALSLTICAWSIWRIGRVVFGPWPGIVAALLVASNLTLMLYAARGFADMPFLALVFVAAALEAERKRRGVSVLLLLATAGLLRPEAWLLAGVYWLWCCWPKDCWAPAGSARSLCPRTHWARDPRAARRGSRHWRPPGSRSRRWRRRALRWRRCRRHRPCRR